eukprot:4604593-Prymnesium_polylepis.1
MKSHDCTRLSGGTIRLCAFAAGHASVCVHTPLAFYTPLLSSSSSSRILLHNHSPHPRPDGTAG